jgi:hypothetical protein
MMIYLGIGNAPLSRPTDSRKRRLPQTTAVQVSETRRAHPRSEQRVCPTSHVGGRSRLIQPLKDPTCFVATMYCVLCWLDGRTSRQIRDGTSALHVVQVSARVILHETFIADESATYHD